MTTNKDFSVFDSDSHVVEPREVWEKYLEPEYRVLGKYALWREEGQFDSYLKINGRVFRDSANPNIPRHAIWQPGMTWDSVGELDPNIRHPMCEGASDPKAKLQDMDAMGIDQTLVYRPGSPKASTLWRTRTWRMHWRGRTTTGFQIFARLPRTASSPPR